MQITVLFAILRSPLADNHRNRQRQTSCSSYAYTPRFFLSKKLFYYSRLGITFMHDNVHDLMWTWSKINHGSSLTSMKISHSMASTIAITTNMINRRVSLPILCLISQMIKEYFDKLLPSVFNIFTASIQWLCTPKIVHYVCMYIFLLPPFVINMFFFVCVQIIGRSII